MLAYSNIKRHSDMLYKTEHEAFVSNLKGTSVGNVLFCLAHIPALVLLIKLVQNVSNPRILRDLVYLALPMLMSVTLLADHCYWSFLVLVLTEIFFLQRQGVLIFKGKMTTTGSASTSASASASASAAAWSSTKKSYLTVFKGSNMLVTIISILAVDFRIFPRRFAKTETFGVSLMDIGVGSFIVASAVTSRYAKGKRLPIESLKSFVNWHTCQRITVLLLGVGRLVALRVLNYQSKDTEYGVHWNFFVTLFFVWGFTDMLHHIVPRQYLPVIAILILATYQTILCKTDLVDFILSAPRTNFFAANREGIFSLFGFVPLYILAEAASHNLFFESVITDTNGATVSKAMALTQPGNDIKIDSVPAPAKYQREGVDVTNVVVLEGNDDGNGNGNGNGDRNNDQVNAQPVAREGSKESNGSVESDTEAQAKKRERGIVYFLGYRWRRLIPQHVKKMSKRLSVFVTFLWVLWMALSAFVQPTSRRMTNMTYVIFVLAVSMTLILLTALADAIGGPSKILTLEYINDWQLPVFMVANVLTGVINLSMKTIYAPPVMAFALLSGYVTSVVGFAWLLGKGWFSRQSTKSSSI